MISGDELSCQENQAAVVFPELVRWQFGTLETARCFLPVRDLPPALQVFAAAVLMLEVIGVFPYIVQPSWKAGLFQRIGLARGRQHLELAGAVLGLREPDPAR